jgi:hypothetical protein
MFAPAYFLAGAHDYTCVTSLVRDYYDPLEAPVKGFYLFEHSAHSPLLEEPQRGRRILQDDVLRTRPPEADTGDPCHGPLRRGGAAHRLDSACRGRGQSSGVVSARRLQSPARLRGLGGHVGTMAGCRAGR